MRTKSQRQVEGFEVGDGYLLPDLVDLLPPGFSLAGSRTQTEETYFDVVDGTLRRLGLTLRRRVGDAETGWQLSVPAEAVETSIADSSSTASLPADMSEVLATVRLGRSLVPVRTTTTGTNVIRVADSNGAVKAVITDEQVVAETKPAGSGHTGWRRISVAVEAGADGALADTVRRRLVASGAKPSTSSAWPWWVGLREPDESPSLDTVGGRLAASLRKQHDEILRGDVGLRLDRPVIGSVRAALHRLVTSLQVFAPVFDEDRAAGLRHELQWYDHVLREVTVSEVLHHRVAGQLATLPPELVLGPVAEHTKSALTTENVLAWRQLRESLSGSRYRNLLVELNRWRTAPPFTTAAAGPSTAAKKYLKVFAGEFEEHNHRARLSADVHLAERMRDAGSMLVRVAELGVGGSGRRFNRALGTALSLQDVLSDHHDGVLTAEFLRRVGPVESTSAEHNGFTYGLLYERELRRTEALRRSIQREPG